jgi:hypothetical protein
MPYNRIFFGDRGSNQSGGLDQLEQPVVDRDFQCRRQSYFHEILEWVRIPPSLRGSVDVL